MGERLSEHALAGLAVADTLTAASVVDDAGWYADDLGRCAARYREVRDEALARLSSHLQRLDAAGVALREQGDDYAEAEDVLRMSLTRARRAGS